MPPQDQRQKYLILDLYANPCKGVPSVNKTIDIDVSLDTIHFGRVLPCTLSISGKTTRHRVWSGCPIWVLHTHTIKESSTHPKREPLPTSQQWCTMVKTLSSVNRNPDFRVSMELVFPEHPIVVPVFFLFPSMSFVVGLNYLGLIAL